MSSITRSEFEPEAPQSLHSKSSRRSGNPAVSLRPSPTASLSQSASIPPPPHDSSEIIELSSEDWGPSRSLTKRDAMLFCFRCHRPEKHAVINRNRWFYSILVGFTFGLVLLIGPFRCRCCGGLRWLRSDLLHPKNWFR